MSSYGGVPIPSIVTPSTAGVPGSPPLGGDSSNEQQIRLQILASLFPPNSTNGAYIAHLKTWEDVPGAPSGGGGSAESKKPRYVLLAVTPDGRCKIHKSKRNTNGTFSIGKTWNLEDLRGLEVHKPRRSAGPNSFAVTCFTITINAKSYLWETESVRQQDDFLVTLVRSYRQYLNGQDPQLIGFQVGEIPGAPPAYIVPGQAVPSGSSSSQQGQSHLASPPRGPTGSSRPGTATSMKSNESQYLAQTPTGAGEYGMAMSASNSGTGLAFAQTVAQGGVRPSISSSAGSFVDQAAGAAPRNRQISPSTSSSHPTQSFAQAIDSVSTREREREGIPPPTSGQQAAMRKKASSTSLREAAAISLSSTSRPPLPVPPSAQEQQQQLRSASPTKPSRSATPSGPAPAFLSNAAAAGGSGSRRPSARSLHDQKQPSSSTSTGQNGATIDEAQAAANAAALLGQPSSLQPDDNDIMLTNVEEMLEGLQWGTSRPSSSGAGGGLDGADQIEKRLLGELNALEAAGIHAIIESDDRVIDVVNYLDSALAELDKMDQMLSLYKTHLHAVNDDIAYVEGQNKGLQIQSSNQRALLAELDKRLGK